MSTSTLPMLLLCSLIAILLSVACTTTPTSVPVATNQPLPTYTPYPTLAPLATLVPLPTHTPYPTPAPLATLVPLPTHTPYPTPIPLATLAPLPTYTPYPTLAPLPTNTPYPTPRSITRTVSVPDNWKFDGEDRYAALGGRNGELWILMLGCGNVTNTPQAWTYDAIGNIYGGNPESEDTAILVEFDGNAQEQTWYYHESDSDTNDYFSSNWAENFVRKLLETKRVVLTIPTAGDDYIVTFDVGGLNQHIRRPSDLCS